LLVTALLEEGLLILFPLAFAVALSLEAVALEAEGSDIDELGLGELDVAGNTLIERDVAAQREPGHGLAVPKVELVKQNIEPRRADGDEVDGEYRLQGDEAGPLPKDLLRRRE
jgi:hypothetical protein